MKKLSGFLFAIVLVFGISGNVNASIYHFTGGAMGQLFDFEAYVDGQKASINTALDIDVQSSSWIRMDVNAVRYKTTFLGISTELLIDKTYNRTITVPGFGGSNIPFSFHLTDLTFQSSIERGPFDINPSTLGFSGAGFNNQADGLLSIAGYIDIAGQQFGFDLERPADSSVGFVGKFDDTGYPDELDLVTSMASGILYMTSFDELLLQTTIDGKLLDLYLDTAHTGTHIYGSRWDGNLVPVPSAIWLLGSGLTGLVGFRRKFRKH